MRRIPRSLVGLATLLLPACWPTEKADYYPTGELKYQAPLNAQGLVDGEAKYFYKNGVVSVVKPYRNGQIDGLVKRYYPSGQLESTAFCKNGEPFGQEKLYYPSGQLKNKATRYGSVYQDTTRSYHRNGEVSQMIIYDDKGRRVYFGAWHPNGKIDTTYTYPFFLSDRDTLPAGQDYNFEVVLGNSRGGVVNVKVLYPPGRVDSTKGKYSRTRFIIRRPLPGRHTVTAVVVNLWARKGSDTLWINDFIPINKSFWVLTTPSKK